MPVSPEQWTILGLVGVIATAGLAKLWVFGWTYTDRVADLLKQLNDMTTDRNFWRDTALKSMGHVDQALSKDDR